ncbi:hypothetical protein GZH46_00710 [Fragariocoptes setiger]|uniref:Uncharacterized protein n=1 Tax=Fragariocoptes setiger TaxID=1670756 RepID=A0ABQ7SBD5_9ACAR|nr:hypothetical protein GZH46_00710 [Fragariocoptes setiger]
MKLIVIALVATFVLAEFTVHVKAQYEECHWECILLGCDFYGDCDYDCYEVCDEYWSEGGAPHLPDHEHRKLASDDPTSRLEAIKAAAGKRKAPIRMSLKRGQNVTSRDAAPQMQSMRSIAVWQSRCQDTASESRELATKTHDNNHDGGQFASLVPTLKRNR